MRSMRNREYEIAHGAVEQPDGSYLNKYGIIIWHNKEGDRHREDGPAFIFTNGNVYWCYNDTPYSFDEWCIQLNKSDGEKMMLRLQYG